MKSCTYCGRENLDSATCCRECGSSELVGTAQTRIPEIGKEVEDTVIELQRCKDVDQVRRITRILDAAAISYRCSDLPPMFDLGRVGAGDDFHVIISVRRECYEAARAAMEIEDLKADIPADHYLLTSSDEELVEIVAHASEWSAFDVAHARRLIRQRGVDLQRIEDKKAERLRQLRQGRPASKKLIFFGWLFSILGGLFGIGIGWSLAFMKEKTPEGEFFTYDEESRVTGRKMLRVAWVVIAVVTVLRLASAFSR